MDGASVMFNVTTPGVHDSIWNSKIKNYIYRSLKEYVYHRPSDKVARFSTAKSLDSGSNSLSLQSLGGPLMVVGLKQCLMSMTFDMMPRLGSISLI